MLQTKLGYCSTATKRDFNYGGTSAVNLKKGEKKEELLSKQTN